MRGDCAGVLADKRTIDAQSEALVEPGSRHLRATAAWMPCFLRISVRLGCRS